MIRVSFDENLLGERPIKPTEPTKPTEPEGYCPPSAAEEGAEQPDTNQENNEGEDVVEAPDAEPARKPEFVKYDQELAAYEQQKVDYELAATKFEQDVKDFDKKVEEGQKLVDELNERFGDWYYVITAENLKTLQTSRQDLITVKESTEGEATEGEPGEQDSSPACRPSPIFLFQHRNWTKRQMIFPILRRQKVRLTRSKLLAGLNQYFSKWKIARNFGNG